MIVHDLDISCAILSPAKNYAPLGVNTNAIESLELTPQWLKSIARRGTKVIKNLRSVKNIEFVQRELVYLAWNFSGIAARYTVKEVRGGSVAERCNHIPRITDSRYSCNTLKGHVTPKEAAVKPSACFTGYGATL